MTLEDKITTYLQLEWQAGDEEKREAVGVAQGCLENYWETIKDNPKEGLTVDGLIKSDLVVYVDAYANDADLTDALEKIVEEHGED